MGVVFVVALDTLFGGVAEYMRVMAILALALLVFSEEREAGQTMVEKHVALPR